MAHEKRAIPGSRREPVPGARRIRDAYPQAPVRVTAVLRRTAPRSGAPAGASDLALVEGFAHEHDLTIARTSPAARSVGLLGTVAQMNAAFGANLGEYELDGSTYRGREGHIEVPAQLADVIVALLGLDDRPQAQAHFRMRDTPAGTMTPHALTGGYRPADIADRYGFPTGSDGAGQTVAVIELGGGYRSADLATYFAAQGVKAPRVTAVSVDTAKNTPGGDADGEVMLDIEVIGAITPGARQAVYFAPNTTKGFYDAIAAALHDTRRKPSVISISWGQAESAWTSAAMNAYDALFADAASLGVTVYAAAGDDGSTDGADSGQHVDFPASSPHVVGCGGTKLTDTDESVWNESATGNGATGGGVSSHFKRPSYQARCTVAVGPGGKPGRGVPDVAGVADPLTGYQVRVAGANTVIGGTSAVAPLWAALTALANQINGAPAGAVHDRLYANTGAFRDITSGSNGGYQACSGWDSCTGLGSPRAAQIIQMLGQ
jgi:kumamolisin